MAMPQELVMVRHGRTEPNEMQAEVKKDPDFQIPEGFHDRHDSEMVLTLEGIGQAVITGAWVREEFPDGFDRYSVSPHARAIQTAGSMALRGRWHIDDRWRERDWGEYGILNETERKQRYELAHKLYNQNKWYWVPPGGESLATGVRLRFEDILDSMHRQDEGKTVIAVTHGETIDTALFVLLRETPQEWLLRDKDEAYKIKNCQAVQFSRTNPVTDEISEHVEWLRSICPWDEQFSWNNGEWIHIEHKTYSDEELLAMASVFPPLLRVDQD